jgi:hypothetical protein
MEHDDTGTHGGTTEAPLVAAGRFGILQTSCGSHLAANWLVVWKSSTSPLGVLLRIKGLQLLCQDHHLSSPPAHAEGLCGSHCGRDVERCCSHKFQRCSSTTSPQSSCSTNTRTCPSTSHRVDGLLRSIPCAYFEAGKVSLAELACEKFDYGSASTPFRIPCCILIPRYAIPSVLLCMTDTQCKHSLVIRYL